VGIGTASPSIQLDVIKTSGTLAQVNARFLAGTNLNGNACGIAVGTSQTQAGYVLGEQTAYNSGSLIFGVQSSGTYTEAGRFSANQNLLLKRFLV